MVHVLSLKTRSMTSEICDTLKSYQCSRPWHKIWLSYTRTLSLGWGRNGILRLSPLFGMKMTAGYQKVWAKEAYTSCYSVATKSSIVRSLNVAADDQKLKKNRWARLKMGSLMYAALVTFPACRKAPFLKKKRYFSGWGGRRDKHVISVWSRRSPSPLSFLTQVYASNDLYYYSNEQYLMSIEVFPLTAEI